MLVHAWYTVNHSLRCTNRPNGGVQAIEALERPHILHPLCPWPQRTRIRTALTTMTVAECRSTVTQQLVSTLVVLFRTPAAPYVAARDAVCAALPMLFHAGARGHDIFGPVTQVRVRVAVSMR